MAHPAELDRAADPKLAAIVDGAARAFHRLGYEACSINDLVGELGMVKGTLYYYVSSKEDLLALVITEYHRASYEVLDRARERHGAPLERIRWFVHGHVQQITRNPLYAGVFYRDFRCLSPARRAPVVEGRDVYEGVLRDLIREAQHEGQACPHRDAKALGLGVFGMASSVHEWFRPDGEWSGDEVAELFADLAVASLSCVHPSREEGPE
jgi:TetR/AcrR family transcriptional regulator, cholesterol catabolism regulator